MSFELEFDYNEKTSSMDTFYQHHIDELRNWIQNLDSQKCIPKNLSDKQLVLFYNACYQDISKTKLCIEKYYTIRKNAPEFFDNRTITSDEMKLTADTLEFFFLPHRSVEGYDIIFHRLHNTDPTKYYLDSGVKLLLMTIDACLYKHGPSPGYLLLFDMRGVRLGHIMRLNLGSLKKFFAYVQEAMPVRTKAIHVLNTEPLIDKILAVIRPFMDRSFYNLIQLHNKDEDLEMFYTNTVPREALPPDYGGTLPDTQTLHIKCMNQLKAMRGYFEAEELQRKAYISDKHKVKHIETAFKKLDID